MSALKQIDKMWDCIKYLFKFEPNNGIKENEYESECSICGLKFKTKTIWSPHIPDLSVWHFADVKTIYAGIHKIPIMICCSHTTKELNEKLDEIEKRILMPSPFKEKMSCQAEGK